MKDFKDELQDVENLMNRLCDGAAESPISRTAKTHLATGGKRLRARLALAAADALGVQAAQAVPWAAACELVHNATLVHDDLQDGDETRRGKPTVWKAEGVASAINAGDLLFMLPFRALESLSVDGGTRWRLAQAIATKTETAVRGQALELSLPSAVGTENLEDLYRETIHLKTSALFELPVYGAALLSGQNDAEATAVTASFAHLGQLFQLQDDVLDLFGDKGRGITGSDIREGKISSLVVAHVRENPEDVDWLLDVLKKERSQTTDEDVENVREKFLASGAKDRVLDSIVSLTEQTLKQSLIQESPELGRLTRWLVVRMIEPIAHVPGFEGPAQSLLEKEF